ncbi:hypothetical protein E2P63_03415 [Candidatus Bathyarchaeota archaeon]|nr:hypothetical protein E2P63_03415 [Candidatus Bathyarchaeota archaeon]
MSDALQIDEDIVENFVAGFLLLGFFSLFFGFIFTITFWYTLPEEWNIKKVNTNRVKGILITVIVIYFILLGYFLSINPLSPDSKWTIKSLIIEKISGIPIEPSYAFYPAITLTSTSFLYATLIIFGILVLPVIIAESGFLDISNIQYHDDTEQPIEGEETYDRFVTFLKRHLSSLNKIEKAKNIRKITKFSLPLATIFIIIGICLIILPPFLIKDGPVALDIRKTLEIGKALQYVKGYMGVSRGQLLLLGILLIIISIFLIRFNRKRTQNIL